MRARTAECLDDSIRRNEQRHGLAHRLPGRVAEEPFRADIPTRDDAVEVLADDRVIRRFDDGGQPGLCLLGLLARRDVLEDHGHATIAFVFDPKGVKLQHAPLGHEPAFEPDRLAGSDNGVIREEPFLGFAWKRLSDGLPDHAAHTGLCRECRVRFDVAKIQRLARTTFNFFDDAKAFIDRRKERPIPFFTRAQRLFGLLALADVVKAIDGSGDFSLLVL